MEVDAELVIADSVACHNVAGALTENDAKLIIVADSVACEDVIGAGEEVDAHL